jgi:hypothetical protein
VRGFHHALEVGAALTIIGAVVAALTLHGTPRPEQSEAHSALAEAG